MINTNYDFIHNTGLSKDNSLVHLIDSLKRKYGGRNECDRTF